MARQGRPYSARTSKTAQSNYQDYLRAHYSYTSEAYQVDPSEYEEASPRRPYVPQQKPKAKVKPAAAKPAVKKTKKAAVALPQYEIDDSQKARMSPLAYMLIIIIFSGAFVFLLSNAFVSQKQIKLNETAQELREIQVENAALRMELAMSYDPEEIERLAQVRLNMRKPSDYQIVYIDVPKRNYFVSYQEPEQKSAVKNIVNTVANVFKKKE